MPRILPTVLHFAAVSAVFALCVIQPGGLPLPQAAARGLCWTLVGMGAALAGWAVAHLRGAVLGLDVPRRPRLLTDGPYRLVRHPIYVGFALVALGSVIGTRSLTALAVYLIVFIPSEVYRARSEEAALRRKFGDEWIAYARRTGPFFPRPDRRAS